MISSAKRLSLEELRLLVGNHTAPTPKEKFFSSEIPEGLTRGSLIEVTGKARTEWIVKILVENPKERVLWIEKELSFFPTAAAQRKLSLDRVLFIETKTDIEWAISTALRSQLFSLIVAPGDIRNEKLLRRYQLLSEKASASLFLLSSKTTKAWSIAIQIEAGHNPTKNDSLQSRLIKFK